VKAACAGLSLCLVAALAPAQQSAVAPKLTGYVKSLLVDSRTVVGGDQHYTLNLNRLRLEIKGPIAPRLAVDLQLDNELLLGDYLHTQQFRLQKELPAPTWWTAQSAWADGPRAYGQTRLYRGSINASLGNTDLRIGRQRVAWGTGRFWSPLDRLNPFSPVALERAERIGVDVLLVEHKFDALSRAAFVYAPQHESRHASAAALWHGNRSGMDYSLVAGRFARETLVGADVAGQIGDAGVRAELTRSRAEGTAGYVRALVGIDYAFANTLTLSGELYFDGAGTRDRRRYDFAALFSGRRQSLARRYLGLSASYDVTPLVKTRHDLVLNLDDSSRYWSPTLTWSLRTNLDATFGAQLFGGPAGSELGAFKKLLYVQLQWFF
jgi:hypothetical protein